MGWKLINILIEQGNNLAIPAIGVPFFSNRNDFLAVF